MSIFEGIGAVSSLLRGAGNLVHELRRPHMDQETFSAVLREELTQRNSPETKRASITGASEQFVRLRDADGDGLLTADESGLDAKAFAKLDLDGDGRLSAEELARPYLKRVRAAD